MPKGYTFEWRGKEVDKKVNKAIDAASLKWGMTVVQGAKGIVHRLSGTLSRSLHVAPDDYSSDDMGSAMVSVMPTIVGSPPRWVGGVAAIAAGSWIDYALAEKQRGGAHDFLSEPVRQANRDYRQMLLVALAREGLR